MKRTQTTPSKRCFLRLHKSNWDRYFKYLTWDSWEAVRGSKEYEKRFKKKEKILHFRHRTFLEQPARIRNNEMRKVRRKLEKVNAPFYIWNWGWESESQPLNSKEAQFNRWEDICFLSKDGSFYWNCTISTCIDEVQEEFTNAFYARYNELKKAKGEEDRTLGFVSISDEDSFKIQMNSGVFYEKGYESGVGLYILIPQTELTYQNIASAVHFVNENEDRIFKEKKIDFPNANIISQDEAELAALYKLIPHAVQVALNFNFNNAITATINKAKEKGVVSQEEIDIYSSAHNKITLTPQEKDESEKISRSFWKKVSGVHEEENAYREELAEKMTANAQNMFETLMKGTQPLDQQKRANKLLDYLIDLTEQIN